MTVTEQALALAPGERLDLIETLWDSLIDDGFELPISDVQRAELRQRLQDHRASPTAVIGWDEARRRLSGK
ncbi:MAG: addiction module protein [Myxococcota bacterium]